MSLEMESTSKDVRRKCIWLRGSDGALLEYESDSHYENEYTEPELNSEGLPERITVKQPPSMGRYRLRQLNID